MILYNQAAIFICESKNFALWFAVAVKEEVGQKAGGDPGGGLWGSEELIPVLDQIIIILYWVY